MIEGEEIMLRTIIKMELKRYFRNPIYYIGAILVFISVYASVSVYFDIQYLQTEEEINLRAEQATIPADRDIMDGFIPATREEMIDLAIHDMREMGGWGEEYLDELEQRKESPLSLQEINDYFSTEYGIFSIDYFFQSNEMRQGNVEEVNQYITERLEEKDFSEYFGIKYVDYFGVSILFFAIAIFAFLYLRDSKKDIYELLHTKPLKSWQYIVGKQLGGMAAITIMVVVITLLYNFILIYYGRLRGFPINFWDIWYGVLLFTLPNLFMVVCSYTLISVIFKSPLPAVPALVLYMVYSNMGQVLEDGRFGYKIRPLAIMVRFPELFFETVIPTEAFISQLVTMLCALIMTGVSILIWRRRRIY